jgi:pimeloyl-ACP methyl ester carboxylesterase
LTELRRIPLSTGVTLNVALAGAEDAPPVILLHGFPESHRTWRGVVPLLEDRFRLVMPDLRGFGASDQPQEVEAYSTDKIVADIFALADALEIDRFALVGHDWGGATAWPAAIRGDPRIERLAIVNAPHPLIFQRSLIEDAEQCAASQYIRAFRNPAMEAGIAAMGLETFFDKSFSKHVVLASIPEEEREHYLADWGRRGALTAMLNWYRASQLVVPEPGETAGMPAWVSRGVPRIEIPVLVIWGMKDRALLPLQLDGLDEQCAHLTIVRLPDAGHFAPWEAPQAVADALAPFLAGADAATAPAQ